MGTLRRTLAVAPLAALVLAGCDDVNSIPPPQNPVVLTGADLPALVGTPPGTIVAFRHLHVDGAAVWEQIPVQVDERVVVDFGSAPAANGTAGVAGTVYGTAPIGVTALQYADPNTFVGADSDPTFDADDELVVLSADAGGKVRDDERTEPAGVVAGSGVVVEVDSPTLDDRQGWVYLFVAAPGSGLDPAAGRDDVDYDFTLTSGPYATTYKRAAGRNPETSVVRTARYEAAMSDRWFDVDWRVLAGRATGVDILDGSKAQFAFGVCGRSNATFADGEGAFVANIDGPLRAIRSYVGANSGPLTQRTELYYGDWAEIVTDLRVHAIPSVMDFVDLSSAAVGMRYRSSTAPGGVVVDGQPDSVPAEPAAWEEWSGPQGVVVTTSRLATSADVGPLQQIYLDDETPASAECWGDGHYYGAAGQMTDPPGATQIPNTDPRFAGAASFQVTRTLAFGNPSWPPDPVAIAERVDHPLEVSVAPYVVP